MRNAAVAAGIRLAPAFFAFGVVAAVGADAGGFFASTWRLTTVALLGLAAAALIARETVRLAAADVSFAGALAAFVAWTAASGAWSGEAARSLSEAERGLVYLAAAVAVLVATDRRDIPLLLWGGVAGISTVCAIGLVVHAVGPDELDPFQGRLLFRPLGYANAIGIYAAIGIVLAVGLVLGARGRLGRAAPLASLVILGPTLYLTESRGAWVALVAGLAAVALTRWRVSPLLLAPALAVAVVAAVLLGSAQGQALSFAGDNRPHYWRVAWQDFREHPVLGSGAGTYVDYWYRDRPVDSFARDAHSLYLESLAELGPLGLVLLLVAFSAPVAALIRARRDGVAVASGGAFVAFALHAGVDWDWEVPAVTIAGLLCGAATIVAARDREAHRLGDRARLALLAPVLALLALALVRLVTLDGLPGA